VPIHGFIKGTGKFPIQKCAIFCKFKDIKGLRGGVLLYAAQAIPPIEAEIAEKGHLWMETSLLFDGCGVTFFLIFGDGVPPVNRPGWADDSYRR
jgi:hypothetical protein